MMQVTPEIIWTTLAALTVGIVLGYVVRSCASNLRRRRMRRELYSIPSGREGRMESQIDQQWRTQLESDLSQLTTAPTDDAKGLSNPRERPKLH